MAELAENTQLGLLFQPQRRIWTVRDLVRAVRTSVEREYTDVWIEGEISNFRPADSGHLYFTLKDGDSQLRVVMFRSHARLLRFHPQNGLQIIARGRITIYDPRGELQLAAEYLEPKGAGALQVAFEQLKQKLAAEGLFDAARKKPLPLLPRCIGIVTSPRGAAIQDLLNILRRRHERANILIYPVQVQGEFAAHEVAEGIRYFNRSKRAEVIIVARGGGSLEDLAPFNDEGLARVAAASELPVISAVGHETDFTILDFVADLRASTPSAAAELVVEAQHQLASNITGFEERLQRAVRYRLLLAKQWLTELRQHRAFARMADLIRRREQRLDDLLFRLAAAQREALQFYRRRLEIATARIRHHDFCRLMNATKRELENQSDHLLSSVQAFLEGRRAALVNVEGRLRTLSPLSILERGYSLVFNERGTLIKDADQLAPGVRITAQFASGSAQARVEKIIPPTTRNRE